MLRALRARMGVVKTKVHSFKGSEWRSPLLSTPPPAASSKGSLWNLLDTMWGQRPRHLEMKDTGPAAAPATTQEAAESDLPRVFLQGHVVPAHTSCPAIDTWLL